MAPFQCVADQVLIWLGIGAALGVERKVVTAVGILIAAAPLLIPAIRNRR